MVEIAGEDVPLSVRWHDRARRYILRLDASNGGARLTLPLHADLDDAIRFLKRHERWLMAERRRLAPAQGFAPGAIVPLRGEEHLVVSVGGARGVKVTGGAGAPELHVSGPEDGAAGRLLRWMKAEARRDLGDAVGRHAARLRVTPKKIAVRDQRSRWGSCSSSGTLSFSWRLIMAPATVLDYVAAHEVAHLIEMNHGPRFWARVRETYGNPAGPRAWLRRHGPSLHRYGGG